VALLLSFCVHGVGYSDEFLTNNRCAFTRGSREEVMIFFEKNKVLGVEPNRVLNILEGILKTNTT
jgi:hypothetical protein